MTLSKIVKFLSIILIVAVGLGVYIYLANRQPLIFGNAEGEKGLDLWRVVIGYLCTCGGVFLGSVYRQLSQLQQTQEKGLIPKGFARKLFRSIDLWMGLSGSPIVFSLILQSTSDMTIPGLIMIALENGFCCLIILNGFLQKETKQEIISPKKAES